MGAYNHDPYPGWIQVHDSTAEGTNYPLLLNPNGGFVGIGVTSTDKKLSVSDTDNICQAIFGQDKTLGISQIVVGSEDADSKSIGLYYEPSSNYEGLRIGGDTKTLVIAKGDTVGNIGVGTTNQFGAGVGVIGIANAQTVPASNPSLGGVLYVQNGALKCRGSSGTVTTIASA